MLIIVYYTLLKSVINTSPNLQKNITHLQEDTKTGYLRV